TFTPHKISSHHAHVSSKFYKGQISLRFEPAVPIPRRLCLPPDVRQNATARHEPVQNPFPESFHNPHPRETRRLHPLRNEQPHSPLEGRGAARCHPLYPAAMTPAGFSCCFRPGRGHR